MAIFKGKYVEESPGQYREATEAETRSSKDRFHKIKKLEAAKGKIEKKLETLLKNCPHTIFRDIAGHPYDVRICAACGHTIALV